MDLLFFLKGVLIGFSIAAPVGPIGILCIKRSITKGALSGFLTGLGAATADALYGIIAAFGLTIISSVLLEYRKIIQVIGICFLAYLGGTIFYEQPSLKRSLQTKSRGLLNDYFSTVVLTIANPMTVLSFAAVFSGLGLANSPDTYLSSSFLVGGIFAGSAMWWILLSNVVGLFQKRITPQTMTRINRGAGSIILGFTLLMILSLIEEF